MVTEESSPELAKLLKDVGYLLRETGGISGAISQVRRDVGSLQRELTLVKMRASTLESKIQRLEQGEVPILSPEGEVDGHGLGVL